MPSTLRGLASKTLSSSGTARIFGLGAQLAREEMKVGLGAMLERFPDMALVDADSVEVLGSILRGPRELRVRVGSS